MDRLDVVQVAIHCPCFFLRGEVQENFATTHLESSVLFQKLFRIQEYQAHSAALNMAFDEALLLQADQPVLRVYQWARPSISFGYFSRFSQVFSRWPEHDWVRRMTGGGTVEHGADITYSLIIPSSHSLAQRSAQGSYEAVHGALADWLNTLDKKCGLAEKNTPLGGSDCFLNPVRADILADGKKIAGAAQRRTIHGLLYQGSIQSVSIAMAERLEKAFCLDTELRDFSESEIQCATRLAAIKYASKAWTERL